MKALPLDSSGGERQQIRRRVNESAEYFLISIGLVKEINESEVKESGWKERGGQKMSLPLKPVLHLL